MSSRAKRKRTTTTTTTPTPGPLFDEDKQKIDRSKLDFDQPKICSESAATEDVFVNLADGTYCQGPGDESPLALHALATGHYVWMNCETGRVYCYPDRFEVIDDSLADIQYNLLPTYTEQQIKNMSTNVQVGKALNHKGKEFIPGCIGLAPDCADQNAGYQNVIVQLLCTVIPLRNFLLGYVVAREPDNLDSRDPVLWSLAQLIRKMYNPNNYNNFVWPREFIGACQLVAPKKLIERSLDPPIQFFIWLMDHLCKKLQRPGGGSVVEDVVQSKVQVFIENSKAGSDEVTSRTESKMSLCMILEVPDEPLFVLDRNDLTKVLAIDIYEYLSKFDGEKAQEVTSPDGKTKQEKRSMIERLPPYAIFVFRRFKKEKYITKNKNAVTFPLKGLDLSQFVHPNSLHLNPLTKYDLVANVRHDGAPGPLEEAKYRIQVLHFPTGGWYEIDDVDVKEVPQMAEVSESYIQVWQRQDVEPDGSFTTVEDIIEAVQRIPPQPIQPAVPPDLTPGEETKQIGPGEEIKQIGPAWPVESPPSPPKDGPLAVPEGAGGAGLFPGSPDTQPTAVTMPPGEQNLPRAGVFPNLLSDLQPPVKYFEYFISGSFALALLALVCRKKFCSLWNPACTMREPLIYA